MSRTDPLLSAPDSAHIGPVPPLRGRARLESTPLASGLTWLGLLTSALDFIHLEPLMTIRGLVRSDLMLSAFGLSRSESPMPALDPIQADASPAPRTLCRTDLLLPVSGISCLDFFPFRDGFCFAGIRFGVAWSSVARPSCPDLRNYLPWTSTVCAGLCASWLRAILSCIC